MSRVSLRSVTLPNTTSTPSKRPTWAGYHHPAVIAGTVDVEGASIALYTMSDGRAPWPARVDVVRLLDGFTCRQIDGGPGLDHLTTPDGLIDVVSPQATAIAVHLAIAAERITAAHGDSILSAIGA